MMNAAVTATPTSAEYLRLGQVPASELEAIVVRGETPDPAALVGWEFRGLNCGSPIAAALPFQKFVKGFYRASADGQVHGYNEPIVQNGPTQPWIAKPRDDDPKRFGFFLVTKVDPEARDNAYLHALLLDYGRGGNSRLDVTRGIRDYLVRVKPGSDDLLLGKAYYKLGPARVPVGFFLLERHRPTTFTR